MKRSDSSVMKRSTFQEERSASSTLKKKGAFKDSLRPEDLLETKFINIVHHNEDGGSPEVVSIKSPGVVSIKSTSRRESYELIDSISPGPAGDSKGRRDSQSITPGIVVKKNAAKLKSKLLTLKDERSLSRKGSAHESDAASHTSAKRSQNSF